MSDIEILEEIIKYFKRNEMVFDKKYKEAIENLLQENKELKEIIFNIRHKLKGKVITKNDNIYAPAKNLSKQEVYQTFVDISIYLKANYIFKDNETALQDLLKGE